MFCLGHKCFFFVWPEHLLPCKLKKKSPFGFVLLWVGVKFQGSVGQVKLSSGHPKAFDPFHNFDFLLNKHYLLFWFTSPTDILNHIFHIFAVFPFLNIKPNNDDVLVCVSPSLQKDGDFLYYVSCLLLLRSSCKNSLCFWRMYKKNTRCSGVSTSLIYFQRRVKCHKRQA